jgi:hypothetical protein
MDNFIPFIFRSGDWIISFIFLYLVIRLYIMRRIEELGEKIQMLGDNISKIEDKIEDHNTRKIDRIDYYADYSEFKAELQELRRDVKNIYFMLGGDKC